MPGGGWRPDRVVNSMRVLLVDPLDSAESGIWASQRWDRIVDLGQGGAQTYARWAGDFQCPVTPLNSLRNGLADLRRIRDLLDRGRGRLTDKYGVDWWEVLSILWHGELETITLLQRLANELGPKGEVHVSRPGFHFDVLRKLQAPVVAPSGKAETRGPGHYLRLSRKLSAQQIADIFGDKFDPGYQFRGRFARRRQPQSGPVVLLPSAYVNVSRGGLAYANTLTDDTFLLVTTRRSAWIDNLPRNVSAAWLSSYASLTGRTKENAEMLSRWQSLRRELRALPEFDMLDRLGYLDSFSSRLGHGLEIRDAWQNVFEREPVRAVLCLDDSNPYTRIPLFLARDRGVPSIACHHGALDSRYGFKRCYADVLWAKGKMEKDYLVRLCGVPKEKVEMGAPAMPASWSATDHSEGQTFRPYVVFFSEMYEVLGGRAEEFYRDVLPPLADLARGSGRTLVVKLHPAESERDRSNMLQRLLSAEQLAATRMVSGSITPELLAKTWAGVTVLSSVAMECAVHGIPCFLCKWLEYWPYGYVDQFIRFGVGIGLNNPEEIAKIPQYVQEFAPSAEVRQNCWHPVEKQRWREILSSSPRVCTAAR